MNEIKKRSGKGFGWKFALNRWSVQERAHIRFCNYRQVLIWQKTVQANSCLNSEQVDTILISVGTQHGGLWGGGHSGPEVQNFTRDCHGYV